MPDTVTAAFQAQYSVIRRVVEGRPQPLTVPYASTRRSRYGAKGTSGFAADENDVDDVYDDVLVLSAAAQGLDLTDLTRPDGRAVAFAQVRYLDLVNLSDTDTVSVEPDVTNGWVDGPTWVIPPSTYDADGEIVNYGRLTLEIPGVTGGAVTGTSKRLSFNPGAATLNVAVVIVGVKPEV